jgi:hypothetical protein
MKAIVRVFLSDGTFKTFLVGSTETTTALKAQVVRKLKLTAEEANKFALYVLDERNNRKGFSNASEFFCKVFLIQ